MNSNNVSETAPPRTKQRVLIGVAFAVVAILGFIFWMRRGDGATEKASTSDSAKKTEGSKETGEKTDPNLVVMEPDAQKNVGIRFASAEKRSVVETIQATGTVGANETRVGRVRALATGRVAKVLVRLGDRVQADQVLATYDNVELGEQIGQYGVARAALARATAEAEVTKRSVGRANNLVNLGAIAKAELEKRTAEYTTALSSIETQRAELDRIEEKLHRFGMTDPEIRQMEANGERHREGSKSTLRAPFTGVITAYNISEGESIDPTRELFTVNDLSTVWVQADLYEKDLSAVRRGVTATIIAAAYPEEPFKGTVTYVGDVLDAKTRTAKVRIEVPNPTSRLKLEMFVTILLPSPKNRDAVMIPAAAVQQINDQPVVFARINDREFRRRDLKLGPRQGDWVEVASGLKPGESVVTQGSFRLKSILLREQIGAEE